MAKRWLPAFAAAVIGLTLVLYAAPVRAQSPSAVRIRADNDAFNFWLPPWSRPDEEYTSGVHATLEVGGEAWWARFLGGRVAPCRPGLERCASRTLTLGQDMYTAARQIGDTATPPGSRPSAGWLYAEETSRVATKTHLDEMSIALGVTGSPAAAQITQRLAHDMAPRFNRPIDWSQQVPFEPGIILRYERTQRMLAIGDGTWLGAELRPHGGASIGNIITEGVAGVRAQAGISPRHPWLPSDDTGGAELTLFADFTEHGVARNEFLSGTLFRESAHVQTRPWLAESQVGGTVRWHGLGVTYRAVRMGSEYTTHIGSHAWSSIETEWRVRP
jgi:hypothetical protein